MRVPQRVAFSHRSVASVRKLKKNTHTHTKTRDIKERRPSRAGGRMDGREGSPHRRPPDESPAEFLAPPPALLLLEKSETLTRTADRRQKEAKSGGSEAAFGRKNKKTEDGECNKNQTTEERGGRRKRNMQTCPTPCSFLYWFALLLLSASSALAPLRFRCFIASSVVRYNTNHYNNNQQQGITS